MALLYGRLGQVCRVWMAVAARAASQVGVLQLPFFGREPEMRVLAELIDGIADRGGALILHGEVGIGKSALVAEAIAVASVSDLRVLTATGVEAEQNLPHAGLHQLLYPIRSGVEALPGAQREPLR